MKKIVNRLKSTHPPVDAGNLDVDTVMHEIIDLSACLHELTSMGLTYGQIVEMTTALNSKANFRNAVVKSLTSN